ncbi:MAG: signal peptide peptidase SppA [Bacteriovoracaceae bacterium]
MKENKRAVYGILMLIFIFFVMIMVFAAFTINAFKDEGDLIASKNKGKAQIGVVELNEVIYDSKKIIELLKKAEEDDSLKAIILRINSPGGAVGPTQEIYEEIRRIDGPFNLKDKSDDRKGKPIYASFGSVAASGGYYLGAATRRIYTNAGTITGSIGVIMQFMDLHKLFEFAMVNPTTIKAGRYKDIGQPNRPMTDEERSLLNTTVADVHEQFIEDILKLRKDKIKGDIRELAQGQIYSGKQALDHGLVDEIAGLEGAGRAIFKELKLEGDFKLKRIEKKKKVRFYDLLEDMEGLMQMMKSMFSTNVRTY